MKRFYSSLKRILTLNCEESTRIVSDSLDRQLSFTERWAVRLHCISCWSCRRFGRQLRALRDAWDAYPPRVNDQAKLSSAAISRIREAMDRES